MWTKERSTEVAILHRGLRLPSLGCTDRGGAYFWIFIWQTNSKAVGSHPLALSGQDRIFCVHGGLSPAINTLDDVRSIDRKQEAGRSGAVALGVFGMRERHFHYIGGGWLKTGRLKNAGFSFFLIHRW